MGTSTSGKCKGKDGLCHNRLTTSSGYSCDEHKVSELCVECTEEHRYSYHIIDTPSIQDIPYSDAMKFLAEIAKHKRDLGMLGIIATDVHKAIFKTTR